jgi:hypothetical protein
MTTNDDPFARRALFVAFGGMGVFEEAKPLPQAACRAHENKPQSDRTPARSEGWKRHDRDARIVDRTLRLELL